MSTTLAFYRNLWTYLSKHDVAWITDSLDQRIRFCRFIWCPWFKVISTKTHDCLIFCLKSHFVNNIRFVFCYKWDAHYVSYRCLITEVTIGVRDFALSIAFKRCWVKYYRLQQTFEKSAHWKERAWKVILWR